MTKSDAQWLFLQDVALLIIYAEKCGYKLTGGELKRTLYQQEEHVRLGASKTLHSDHLDALAVDLNIFFDYDGDGDKDYVGTLPSAKAISEDLGEYWKSLHPENYWGGDFETFTDCPHFGRKYR